MRKIGLVILLFVIISVLGAQTTFAAKRIDYYKRANEQVKLGKYQEAIVNYDKAIKQGKNTPEVHCQKAYALYFVKKYDTAINECNIALKRRPNLWAANYIKASIFHDTGNYIELNEVSDKLIRLRSKEPYSYYFKGNALVGMKKYDNGIVYLDKAIKLFKKGKYKDVLYNSNFLKATAYVGLGEIDQAFKSYDNAIKIDPNRIEAYIDKGVQLINLSRSEEAIKVFDKVLKIDPNSAIGHVNKAAALIGLGKYKEGISFCEKAFRLNKKNDKDIMEYYYINRSAANLWLYNWEDGLKDSNKAIEIAPDNPLGYINKAAILIEMNKLDGLEKIIDKSIELAPKSGSAYINKSVLFIEQKKYDKVIETCNKAIKLEPKNKEVVAQGLMNIGSAYKGKNNIKKAKEYYQKALNSKPKDIRIRSMIYTNISYILSDEGKYEDALKKSEEALNATKMSDEALASKGVALIGLKKYKDAMEVAKKTIEINDNNYIGHYVKGIALSKEKKNNEAIKELEISLKLKPNYKNSKLAKEKILAEIKFKKILAFIFGLVIGAISIITLVLIVKNRKNSYSNINSLNEEV